MAKRIPLDKVCVKKVSTLSPQYDGLIDYVDISSVDNTEKRIVSMQCISAKEAPSRAKHLLEVGDILVSTVRPNLNAVAMVEQQTDNLLVGSTGYCVLRCNDSIDRRYVFHFCQSSYFVDDMTSQATGASYPAVSSGIVKSSTLPERSIEQQKEIADRLDKVSKLIALRKEQLAKLDQLLKSRFIELFGDPISNPMGWKTKRFDSLCENLDSRRKPITASEREVGIYPYYGASGIVDYVSDYLFDEDILLVSEDGANLLMRSTPIAFSVSGKVWVNNHAHVVRFEKMSMQKYIEVFFSMIDISEHITGSAQPKLNQAKLNAMMFPVPDDDRLEAFLSFIEQTDKSKLAIQQSLDKLELLKKSLMQEYFG